jgi:protein involved in polysaccharide export with SLBB domain
MRYRSNRNLNHSERCERRTFSSTAERVGHALLCALGAIVVPVFITACATGTAPTQTDAEIPITAGAAAPSRVGDVHSVTALDALWQARLANQQDFPIGPGDELVVSVPNVKELNDCTVRVSGDGTVLLPLIGSLHIAGLTQPQAVDHITDALHKYVYHPRVGLQVKTFASRVVGVNGAVHNPGTYVLYGPSDTVHDLIERAGGLTEGAAREVLLTPMATSANNEAASQSRASNATPVTAQDGQPAAEVGGVTRPVSLHPQEPSLPSLQGRDTAYIIDLSGSPTSRDYSQIPARPGDSLFVPAAGQVSVVGWVTHPVVVPIANGLTVLGAIAAAGGTLYAADSSSVKVLRRQANGQMKVIDVNLDAVKSGGTPDVTVQANDVVDVGYSAVKIPGYAVYTALKGVVQMAPAAMIVGGVP